MKESRSSLDSATAETGATAECLPRAVILHRAYVHPSLFRCNGFIQSPVGRDETGSRPWNNPRWSLPPVLDQAVGRTQESRCPAPACLRAVPAAHAVTDATGQAGADGIRRMTLQIIPVWLETRFGSRCASPSVRRAAQASWPDQRLPLTEATGTAGPCIGNRRMSRHTRS